MDASRHQAEEILPIIDALQQGGIEAIEITLRNSLAIDAIAIAKATFPNIKICAGSLTTIDQIEQLEGKGIDFIILPGINEQQLFYCQEKNIDILPGVMSPSYILLGMQHGLRYCKFFPAAVSGGAAMLKSISAPFPEFYFCATGGINYNNVSDFLAMKNVFCIPSSAIATEKNISQKNWQAISEQAQAFTSLTTL